MNNTVEDIENCIFSRIFVLGVDDAWHTSRRGHHYRDVTVRAGFPGGAILEMKMFWSRYSDIANQCRPGLAPGEVAEIAWTRNGQYANILFFRPCFSDEFRPELAAMRESTRRGCIKWVLHAPVSDEFKVEFAMWNTKLLMEGRPLT